MSNYRDRIYRQYVQAREQRLAPCTIDGLNQREPWFNRIIRNYFPSNRESAIFEMGAGHGAFIYFIKKAGYGNVLGVDYSSEQISEARRLGIDGIVEGDLLTALKSLPEMSQDVVIAIDVIEHFNKDELIEITDEVYRILKPSGIWIINAPNGESPFGSKMLYWDFTHEQAFTRNSIHQLLKSFGFRHVGCHENTPVPHGIKSGVRFILWKCIRLFLLFYILIETGQYDRNCVFTQNMLVVASK